MQEIINKLMTELGGNDFLSGGLILGALTTMVMYLKWIPSYLYNFLLRRIRYEVSVEPVSELFSYVQKWLMDCKSSKLRRVDAFYRRVTSDDHLPKNHSGSDESKRYYEHNNIVYHYKGDSFIFFYRGRIIQIRHEVEKLENASTIQSVYFGRFLVNGLFAKHQINELLQEIIQYNIDQEKARTIPTIWNHGHNGYWNSSKRSAFKNLDHIFIPGGVKEKLAEDIQSFIDSRTFYSERGISYRRGYGLHGPPGTGKSSLVSAFTLKMNRDLYILNLNVFKEEVDFRTAMNDIRGNSIVLIEDIDSYFENRDNKTKISFSTFINAISGVDSIENTVLFVTTNKPELLDEAMVRSGRIDMMVEIPYPTASEIDEYISFFYSKEIRMNGVPRPGLSIADVENICCQYKHDYSLAVKKLQMQYRLKEDNDE